MQRILPLVRFNLMETQFFRQDVFNLCYKGILTFGLRRVVRFNPLLGPEVEEKVERLFYTRTPARSLPPSSYLLCLTRPDCRSPRSLLLAFGGWSRAGSGDTAVIGPSPDILIFNPASRFNAEHQCHPCPLHCNRSWQRMEQRLPQPVAYTSAAGLNNRMIANE